MISASLSLSLPRLGWKSTSMPRSVKVCAAAGDSASEMRTLGFVMGMGSVLDDAFETRHPPPKREACLRVGEPRAHLEMDGRSSPAITMMERTNNNAAMP